MKTMIVMSLIMITATACAVERPTTSTDEQGLYCDPFCDPYDTVYLTQVDHAMLLWSQANCTTCSTSCETSDYTGGQRAAICDAVNADGWLVGQCWAYYRSGSVADRGCAAIPNE